MLAYCIRSGMSLSDFYDAELWEVGAVLKTYFSEKEKEFRHGYEIARFQMSGMIDTKSIKFPWEIPAKKLEDLSEEEIERHKKAMEVLDARARNEAQAKAQLIEMGYSRGKARELILKAASSTRKIIEVSDLVNMAING